jgi:hypothetical protein
MEKLLIGSIFGITTSPKMFSSLPNNNFLVVFETEILGKLLWSVWDISIKAPISNLMFWREFKIFLLNEFNIDMDSTTYPAREIMTKIIAQREDVIKLIEDNTAGPNQETLTYDEIKMLYI